MILKYTDNALSNYFEYDEALDCNYESSIVFKTKIFEDLNDDTIYNFGFN